LPYRRISTGFIEDSCVQETLYPAHGSRDWRELYKAALFETNKQELPRRITEAEKALIVRAREPFSLSGNRKEEQAIDDALYALRSLRNCFELKDEESGTPRTFHTHPSKCG